MNRKDWKIAFAVSFSTLGIMIASLVALNQQYINGAIPIPQTPTNTAIVVTIIVSIFLSLATLAKLGRKNEHYENSIFGAVLAIFGYGEKPS